MSLQVWLPLTQDLRQQGLSTGSITSSNASFDTNGKLGGCYVFSGVDNAIGVGNLSTMTSTDFTFTCWFYHDDTWSSKSWETIFGGPSGFELQAKNSSTNSPVIYLYSWGKGNFTYELNKWNHLAMVRTASDTKIYLNGELKITGSAGSIPNGNYFVGSWRDATSQNFKGKMCDVRIYDNALSPQEIKEISKGLVLHYPLNDNNLESTVNIFSTTNNGSGIAVDCTSTTMTGYHPNQNVTLSLDTMLNGLPCIRCNTEQTSSTPGIELCYNWQVEQNTNYTFSAWIESNCAAGLSAYQIKNTTYKAHPNPEFVSVTFNSGTNTVIRFFLFIIASNTVSGQYAKISHPQLEAKDHVTGFTTSERLNPIVYDTSGYLRNGIINRVLEIKEDTPKYKLSTYFDNDTSDTTHPSQKIYITNEDVGLKSMSQFTISAWFKQINFNRGGKITTSAPTSTNDYYATSGVDDYDAQIHFRTTDNSVVTISGFYNKANEWDHIVFTFDGIDVKEYLNGELKETKSFSSAKTIDISHLTIGASNAGGVSRCYKGYVSDYRIYATALSADDIKSLYQNEAAFDDQGNLLGPIR